MRCNQCNREWNVPESLTAKVTFCPICGAPITAAPSEEKKTETDPFDDIFSLFHSDGAEKRSEEHKGSSAPSEEKKSEADPFDDIFGLFRK